MTGLNLPLISHGKAVTASPRRGEALVQVLGLVQVLPDERIICGLKLRNGFLFEVLLIGFSALLLVLMLLNVSALQQCEDSCARLQSEISATQRENELIYARCQSAMSLGELEAYAREVLGMQTARPRQTVYTQLIP